MIRNEMNKLGGKVSLCLQLSAVKVTLWVLADSNVTIQALLTISSLKNYLIPGVFLIKLIIQEWFYNPVMLLQLLVIILYYNAKDSQIGLLHPEM